MKQYITTLHSATAAICTAALVATIAACTATEPHALPTTTDPLTALAPTTTVGIAATLQPYGNGTATRTTATAHVQLQAIPAAGEITLSTPLEDVPQMPISRTHAPATTTSRANATQMPQAQAVLQLPGAKEESNTFLNLYGSTNTVGNIGSAPLYTGDPESPEQLNGDGILKLLNFNLSPTTTAGASQPHSRIGILRLYTSADELMAIAPITTATDNNGTPIATMPFTLKHTGAKVSVLLVYPGGTPIDATTTATTLKSAHIAVRRAFPYFIYTGTGTPTTGYPSLFHYLRGNPSDTTYPHDPTPLADYTALALTPSSREDTNDYTLTAPTTSADATPAVPSNLINGLIPACPTHKVSNNIFTPLDDTPRPYKTDEALILKMNIATGQGTATKEVTYTLPLTSITLTGLPDGDPRIASADNTGPLTYLRPGEHLVLTVTVDTDLQTITASATVGAWSTGTATATPEEQPTGAAPTE